MIQALNGVATFVTGLLVTASRVPGREAPPAHFLHGGDMYSRGSIMKPGFLTVLNGDSVTPELPPAHQRTSFSD